MFASGAEAGTNAAEFNRCAQEGLAHAGAIQSIVVGSAAGISVTHGLVPLALIYELCGQDVTGIDTFTIKIDIFIQHGKAIAFTYVECKIDVPSENARQFHGELVRQAGLMPGHEQGAVDSAAGANFAVFGCAVGGADIKVITAVVYLQCTQFVDRIDQFDESLFAIC